MLCASPIHCSLPAFVIYILVFQGHQGHSAPLHVTAPPDPITVAKGENVVLPCGFSPGQDAQDTEVIWFREQVSPFVHRYKEGQDQYGEQMFQYQGRTELLKDGLDKGSADLKIFHVQPSDTGSYTCFVRRGSDYDEAQVELQVTASGSAPLIALERYEHGGIRVACRSAGWYPRPRVLWHDSHGQHLPSLSENATQDKNGLFAAESSIILTRGVNQELSCSVQHILHRPEQGSALYVSDPFFQDAHPWKIALGMVLVAVVVLLIINVYLFKIKGKHQEEIERKVAAALRDRDAEMEEEAQELERQKEALRLKNAEMEEEAQELERQKEALRLKNAEMEEQAQELAWRRYAVPIEQVNVVLDPDTAHCELVVSDSGKSVKRGGTRQDIPDTPKRFDGWSCILGCEGFTSGRHYWDVEVEEDAEGWTVGVFREDAKRKGYFWFKPEEGIWAVGKWVEGLIAFTLPDPTLFPEIKVPRRIRVSLDYEEGRVSFFSVDEGIPIFTFPQASFGGKKVYPLVWVGPDTCLKICP